MGGLVLFGVWVSLISRALLCGFVHAEPLVGDLREGSIFDLAGVQVPEGPVELNLDQKLGHFYEDALACLLGGFEQIEVLGRNVQIQSDIHTTLGELDFVLRRAGENELIHLELAVKFYLAVEKNGEVFYPGPDARGNYQQKLDRLRSHQLKLVHRSAEFLPEEFRGKEWRVQQLVHGCLFDHVDSVELASPEGIHDRCRRGRWLRFSEVERCFGSAEIQIIPKPLWPVPISFLGDIELKSWERSEISRCVMVRVEGQDIPYFIAPDIYPDVEKVN